VSTPKSAAEVYVPCDCSSNS